MKRLYFRYYRSFRVQCTRIVTKNGERKCQQNSSAKVRRVWRSKIHIHTCEKKGNNAIRYSQACSRSNNAETNSFFAPLPNQSFAIDIGEKNSLKSCPLSGKSFPITNVI